MKKTILSIIFASAIMVSSNAQKMATVNSSEVVMNMSETKALQQKVQDKSQTLSKELEIMYKQFEEKAAKLKGANQQSLNAIQEAQMAELQDLQKRIENFEKTAQKEVQQLEQTLSIPILEKAKKVIEQVAAEKGYSHVFDVSAGGMIIFPIGDDITNAVKTKLGIPLTTPAPAGASSTPTGVKK